ncbi:MAG TPA: CHAT domain-containing protein [Kofleriaceae bacterium]|nr:CHAT domain-containing protein [Kofleriaceae bacterium]
MPKGPATFAWSARQRDDLEALWRSAGADAARDRMAHDLAAFCDQLGWVPDAAVLEDAERRGDEYLLTLSAVPPELYLLPWEVIQVGASYLSRYASAQVRYAVPGLPPRDILGAPATPGVLFAWSAAGGAVPHAEQAAAIRAATDAGGTVFRELPHVDVAGLTAALAAGPPSVLHLLCHGAPGADGEPPRLTWGAADDPSSITATDLARLLRPHAGTIRLVVLSACGSGDGHGDPLYVSSLAQELHRNGIPDVVASRYPLSVHGSQVMTRVLYDKMLRDAWSLERALRHTRATLFDPAPAGTPAAAPASAPAATPAAAPAGERHPGDAYGIQLYAYDTEQFLSDNNVVAERPVLASYPFGTAARPVPASGPPRAELTLGLDADAAPDADLTGALRKVAEDDQLTISSPAPRSVVVRTTVDGAQRLLGAWRSKVLQAAVGVILGELILTKGILPALAGTPTAAAGGEAAKTATPHIASPSSQAAGSASQAGATTATATAQTVVAAGTTIATHVVVAAVVGSVAVIGGGVAVYKATRPAPVAVATREAPSSSANQTAAPSPPPLAASSPGTRPPSAATNAAARTPSAALPPAAATAPMVTTPSVATTPPATTPPATMPPATTLPAATTSGATSPAATANPPAVNPLAPPVANPLAPPVANPPAPPAAPASPAPALPAPASPAPASPAPATPAASVADPPPIMPPVASADPGLSQMKLSFTAKKGLPATPIRTRSYVLPGTDKAVAFVVPQQSTVSGPAALISNGAQLDTKLTVSAQHTAADKPQQLTFHAFRSTACGHVLINDAIPCKDGGDFLQLGLREEDNLSVPAGVYTGRFQIEAEDGSAKTVIELVTFDYTVSIEHDIAGTGTNQPPLPTKKLESSPSPQPAPTPAAQPAHDPAPPVVKVGVPALPKVLAPAPANQPAPSPAADQPAPAK